MTKLTVATRIELSGRLTRKPESRVTPAGTRTLRLEADCGEGANPLLLEIVATGDRVPELTRNLREGVRIHATGSLRALPSLVKRRLGIEVIADRVELDPDGTGN